MKEFAKKFYKSKAWRNTRLAYFNLQHGLCERCEGTGKIVHHIKELTPSNINNPDIALSFDNFELLCQDCHNRQHHGSEHAFIAENLYFNGQGELVERR